VPSIYEVDSLRVVVCRDRAELGATAGSEIAAYLRDELRLAPALTGMFASAPSQNETIEALIAEPGIPWSRVHVLHLDEYDGTTAQTAYSFRRYLLDRLVSKVDVGSFDGLRGEVENLERECERYSRVLKANPPSFGLLGIGENGHLAFNDPPFARFDDPAAVRVVELTEKCRMQQVHDATFPTLDDVPRRAITVTIPAIVAIPRLFVMVPGQTKAAAIAATLRDPVSESCPASILRRHPNTTLFVDLDSAANWLA
jgi:glucosamine-6-phosphate deaminase